MARIVTEAGKSQDSLLDASTRSMLAGLASMHAVTIACDSHGTIQFLRDHAAAFDPGRVDRIGQPIAALGSESLTRIARAGAPGDPVDVDLALDLEPDPARGSIPPGDRRVCIRRLDVVDRTGMTTRILLADPLRSVERFARKNAELESSLRSLSHDLRSPLVSVLGFTRLLRDEFGEAIGRTGRHFVERIEQAGHNMQRLIDDTLELARLDESQRLPVHVSPTAVLEQIAAELKLQLDESDIVLQIPGDAPVIVFDRTQLYQLFSNLIGNALRHTGQPGRSGGRIDVTVEPREGGFEIAVADDGPGIAEEDAARIFEAFETVRKPGDAKRGSGLGLAIVKKIAVAHGGRVFVERADLGGARFVVHLPGN